MELNYLNLFQVLLYFYWFEPPSPQGGGRWQLGVSRVWGYPIHMQTHTCMHAHTHVKKLQMATTCLPWCCPCGPRGPHIIPMSSPSCPHHPHIVQKVPTSSQPPPQIAATPTPHPQRGRGINKNSIRFELIEIFQFCLKIWNLWRLPHSPKIYDLLRHSHL